MEAMLGISLYSYPNLNYQKHFVLLITVHTPSSTKLYAHINNQKKKKVIVIRKPKEVNYQSAMTIGNSKLLFVIKIRK
jgi:hypothetical protein